MSAGGKMPSNVNLCDTAGVSYNNALAAWLSPPCRGDGRNYIGVLPLQVFRHLGPAANLSSRAYA